MTALEDRLRLGPAAVLALVKQAKRPLSIHDPIYWHGLAEGAGFHARKALDGGAVRVGLEWAQCAVEIYDALASDVPEPHSFDVSGMFIRARAIRVWGERAGDIVLDARIITDWVREALVYSRDEATRRSVAFRAALAAGEKPHLDDERQLRRMKHRLTVFAELPDVVRRDSELAEWLITKDQLV